MAHKNQWGFLEKMVLNNKVPQAIIFAGVSGIGKKKVAFEFAKYLNCSSEKKPCLQCYSCSAIENNNFLDLVFIAPEVREIQIGQIRDIQEKLSLKPNFSSYQVVIIDKAETMNQQASNCFLKTLEEPKGKTLFILITSVEDSLMPTIRSRCSILKFYPVKGDEMIEHFKKDFHKTENFKEIIDLSEGRTEIAYSLFKENAFKEYLQTQKIINDCFEAGIVDRFVFAKNLFKNENNQSNAISFLDNFITYLRKKLLLSLEKEDLNVNIKIKNAIMEAVNIRSIVASTNVSPRLAIENLFLNI